MRCTYCGSYRHTITNCPRTADGLSNRMHMRCTYCGSKNHNVNACPKTQNGISNITWHKEKVENDYLRD